MQRAQALEACNRPACWNRDTGTTDPSVRPSSDKRLTARERIVLLKDIMKMIPRVLHGAADYFSGLFLLLAPNLLAFGEVGGAAVWVPRIVGLLIFGQAMMTDYELGLMRVIPIGVHLMTDYLVGVFLLAAPWLFGFSAVGAPTIAVTVVGLLVLGLTVMTQPAGWSRKVMAYRQSNESAQRMDASWSSLRERCRSRERSAGP